MTSHPKDVGADLIEEFGKNPVLVPHFHLPVQSGSTKILKEMRRQYSREQFLDIVTQLRLRAPTIKFSTDIIVGFPGETDEDFKQTLSLMKEIRFDQVYSFVYSPRPFTSAVKLSDDVPLAVKQERLRILQTLDKKITLEQNVAEVGKIEEVLVEEKDDEQENPYLGRTLSNKVVHFQGEDLASGDLVDVEITQANPYSLYGKVL